MTFRAVHGSRLDQKFPDLLARTDLNGLVEPASALGATDLSRWFRRLYVSRRLALHCHSSRIGGAEADALPALALRPDVKWGFAHGDITARNVLRDYDSNLALVNWEWAEI
jgi:hypothetical protein